MRTGQPSSSRSLLARNTCPASRLAPRTAAQQAGNSTWRAHARIAQHVLGWLACSAALACEPAATTPQAETAAAPTPMLSTPEETHFADVRQLTTGGENAEAYWSFDGKQLIYQAHAGEGCDQIYTLDVTQANPTPKLVSTGGGATTCAYFLPGDKEIVYASTHLGGKECPTKPDHSMGYVWGLFPTYDIFRANADGTNLRQLTTNPGYDAEATVCGKDGTIVFTSVRDGDLELYSMDAEGQNVKRLTNTPGYDGGAFFSADCSKIVWRASRPTGEALKEFQDLLSKNIVRPNKLEIYVANADGSDAKQLTYLNAAAFAPYFFPSGDRILFSTNAGDPKGREFDIWAVGVDGSGLERITYAPGFDGFPMFSPDGKYLAFGSNRTSRPGTHDTNVFIARWVDHPPPSAAAETRATDRMVQNVRWLADPARQGRGVETDGLAAAGAYIEQQFQTIGLQPAGPSGSYRQDLQVVTSVQSATGTRVSIGQKALGAGDFSPAGFSGQGEVGGDLVLAGYGIVDEATKTNDYANVDAKGKVVVVRRFVPDTDAFKDGKVQRRLGDLRYKAWTARERGAKALIVVDLPAAPPGAKPDWQPPSEAAFVDLKRDGYGDAGIPVVMVKRAALSETIGELTKKKKVPASISVELNLKYAPVFNVLGRLPAQAPEAERLPGVVVVGAHYDHLGLGGHGSLAPDDKSPHLGADDNASGVATIIEVASRLAGAKNTKRDIVFMAFTAEEMGVLGSSHLVQQPPPGLEAQNIYAMLNFDMVGRMRDNRLLVLGSETAKEWNTLVPQACAEARISCELSGGGYGPSDHSSFYTAGVPVLHFFTGSHHDYHKPTDRASEINGAGMAAIADMTVNLLSQPAEPKKLTYQRSAPSTPAGDLRTFNASLGTVPDYGGPKGGKGVLLADVRAGSAAEKGGLKRGDVLVRLGTRPIEAIHDLMFVLNTAKPNETVTAVVLRDGKELQTKVTFQARAGSGGAGSHRE
jgi:Tol biopolymer transport system component